MATLIYRAGTGHNEGGIECEINRCEPEHLESQLASGWSLSPPALETDDGDLTSDEVRELAKEAGIDGWDTKRIKTLKEAMGI
tara:strand:+ start:395 stop:643 length:249 start_codon:yes stop_codon:yes gene_type:complete